VELTLRATGACSRLVSLPCGHVKIFAGLSGYGAANGRLNPVQKPNWRKESDKKMNKKLVVLLIPLLLLPLVAFGYAHWTDSVTKKYKFHFGKVEVEVVKWHVDACTTWDNDSDGVVFGEFEEVWVKEVYGADGQCIGFEILCNPVGPGFVLNFTMLIHNKGRLPVEVYAPILKLSNLTDTDPCWTDFTNMTTWPSWFIYTYKYYAHPDTAVHNDFNANDYTFPIEPTGRVYEPSQCIKITQKIYLPVQGYPELQCHWFKFFVEIPIRNANPSTYSSYKNETRGWP